METYQLADCALVSDIEFPELDVAFTNETNIRLKQLPDSKIFFGVAWERDIHRTNIEVFASLAYLASKHLIRVHGIADFSMDYANAEIAFHVSDHVPIDTLRHLILDQILPFFFHQWRYSAFHASAVQFKDHAIAFLGDSGSGKSTLAAMLVQKGLRFITDDCLLLEKTANGFICYPYYPNMRLWEDSYQQVDTRSAEVLAPLAQKKRLKPKVSFSYDPLPIKKIFVMSKEVPVTASPKLEKLSPSNAFMSLARYSFLWDYSDRDKVNRDVEIAAYAADNVDLYSLAFPRHFELMDTVISEILHYAE
ncbi:MAG: hypothetical protein KC708_10095 [Anaerolineae bacterium]|nr:hypothetical protein [Anaerolineae bacterium]